MKTPHDNLHPDLRKAMGDDRENPMDKFEREHEELQARFAEACFLLGASLMVIDPEMPHSHGMVPPLLQQLKHFIEREMKEE